MEVTLRRNGMEIRGKWNEKDRSWNETDRKLKWNSQEVAMKRTGNLNRMNRTLERNSQEIEMKLT